jgi:hypothetical protein
VAAFTFVTVMMVAGSSDVIAVTFGVSVNVVIWTLRTALIVLPPIAGLVAARLCVELRRRDAAPPTPVAGGPTPVPDDDADVDEPEAQPDEPDEPDEESAGAPTEELVPSASGADAFQESGRSRAGSPGPAGAAPSS